MGPGGSGMVNELLIQMQSFDQPPWRDRGASRLIEMVNAYLPPEQADPCGEAARTTTSC